MVVRWHILASALAGALLLAQSACDRNRPPTSQPTTQPAPALPSLLEPASLEWSKSQAREKLADKKLGLSAAIRLVYLSELAPLCVPNELTDDLMGRLKLVELNDTYWALGLANRRDEHCLHAPVLITGDGEIEELAEVINEELLVLHVSDDSDVFPHVALLPPVAMLIENEVSVAMVLEPDAPVQFALRRQDGFPYVALALLQPGDADEVAKYVWDPYEETFFGPLIDILPDPPGGKFCLDPDASLRLEPMGGELPEPKALPEPPDEPRQRPIQIDRLPV